MNAVTRILLRKSLEGLREHLDTVRILLEDREKVSEQDAPEEVWIKLNDLRDDLEDLIEHLKSYRA